LIYALKKFLDYKVSNLLSPQAISLPSFDLNKLDEYKKLHGILDYFQNGKTGLRTALIIDALFNNSGGLDKLNLIFKKIVNLKKNNKVVFAKKY